MISFILELAKGVFGFLLDVLPDSPFQSLIEGATMLQTGIGWLNWVFPVGQALALAGAWLAACLLIAAAKIALQFFGKGASLVSGE